MSIDADALNSVAWNKQRSVMAFCIHCERRWCARQCVMAVSEGSAIDVRTFQHQQMSLLGKEV
jgi:Fe-S-cluster-containing hydrogenase component 2